jgi:hypothetical protein
MSLRPRLLSPIRVTLDEPRASARRMWESIGEPNEPSSQASTDLMDESGEDSKDGLGKRFDAEPDGGFNPVVFQDS